MHVHQFWWAWLLQFRSYGSFLIAFKTAKISLRTMDYSPWSSKNLIEWNRLKKFMQVGIDITCMHTNFGGHGLCYGPFLIAFKTGKISLRTMDYSPWSSKNLIDWNRLKKFMQVGIDVTCMYTNFGGHGLSSFRVMAHF